MLALATYGEVGEIAEGSYATRQPLSIEKPEFFDLKQPLLYSTR